MRCPREGLPAFRGQEKGQELAKKTEKGQSTARETKRLVPRIDTEEEGCFQKDGKCWPHAAECWQSPTGPFSCVFSGWVCSPHPMTAFLVQKDSSLSRALLAS